MKGKVLLLALSLALVLPLSALAAEEVGFSDVEAGSWYAEGVRSCVEQGLMEGTGDGVFSPDRRLSQPECLTLALRLYDLCHGRDGALEKAPEDWALLTLSFADGTDRSHYIDDDIWIRGDLGNLAALNGRKPYLGIALDAAETLAWGTSLDGQPASVDYGGKTYPGVTRLLKSVYPWAEEDLLVFYTTEEALELEWNNIVRFIRYDQPGPQSWYRDATYRYDQLTQSGALPEDFADNLNFDSTDTARRLDFARTLAESGAELPAVNEVETIPDCDDANVLTLYRAGVLTGSDAYGTFLPSDALSRAEAAALCARVLHPELRKTASLSPLPTDGYTLTYLAEGTQLYGLPNTRLCNVNGEYLLTLDGRRIPYPEEGIYGYDFHFSLDRLVVRGGVMDGDGNWLLPYGTYEQITPTADGHLIKQVENEWFLLNGDGTQAAVFPPTSGSFAVWDLFNDGLAPDQDEETDRWGYVDQTGAWGIPPQWTWAYSFLNGYAAVLDEENRCGLIDRSGNLVVPHAYKYLKPFENSLDYSGGGLLAYEDWEGGTGWVDLEGNSYHGSTNSSGFHNGYAAAFSLGGKGSYYLGLDGQPVSQRFDWCEDIGPDGAGFVGLDGMIWRIQFDL